MKYVLKKKKEFILCTSLEKIIASLNEINTKPNFYKHAQNESIATFTTLQMFIKIYIYHITFHSDIQFTQLVTNIVYNKIFICLNSYQAIKKFHENLFQVLIS